jgi:hypothetical protein
VEQEDHFEKALRSPDPVASLRALVLDFSAKGHRKARIIELFEERLAYLQKFPEREADADAVRDVLDFLLGWCSPHMKLLPEGDDISPTVPRRSS